MLILIMSTTLSSMSVNKMGTQIVRALYKKAVKWNRHMSAVMHTVFVHKTATKNIWWHHFLQPGTLLEVGETVAHIRSQVMGTGALQKIQNWKIPHGLSCSTYSQCQNSWPVQNGLSFACFVRYVPGNINLVKGFLIDVPCKISSNTAKTFCLALVKVIVTLLLWKDVVAQWIEHHIESLVVPGSNLVIS
jgi:hypothetical protein